MRPIFIPPTSAPDKERPYLRVIFYHKFKITREFEPESFRDFARIPVSLIRWIYALCWFHLAYWKDRITGHWAAGMRGRHSDPAPVCCNRCMWAGPRAWCIHGYDSDGFDVTPSDECPVCGSEL